MKMKFAVVVGLFAIFATSADALVCKFCQGLTWDECEANGETQECSGVIGTGPAMCETFERMRNGRFTYERKCKESDVCQNEEKNNPNDCHRSDPYESLCRCCCSGDLCDPDWNKCLGGPPVATTTPTPVTIINTPVVSQPNNSTSPVEPLNSVCCTCPELETPTGFDEVECDLETLSNTEYPPSTSCKYICEDGLILQQGVSDTRVCTPRLCTSQGQCSVICEWSGTPPQCIGNPAEQCADPPIWRETPPGDIQGTVECGNLPDSPPYPIGHECNYTCPAGYHLVGTSLTTCSRNDVTNLGEFRPQSPCCARDCEKTDILFIIDGSSSIDENEWPIETGFVADLTRGLEEQENVHFAVEVFAGQVDKELTIGFQPWSEELIDEIADLPFARRVGTGIPAALDYATDIVFGTDNHNRREDARRIVVFITDGVCTIPRASILDPLCPLSPEDVVQDAATRLQTATDVTFSIGIGLDSLEIGRNKERAIRDLGIIASAPENVFSVTNFTALSASVDNVILRFCSDSCLNFEQ